MEVLSLVVQLLVERFHRRFMEEIGGQNIVGSLVTVGIGVQDISIGVLLVSSSRSVSIGLHVDWLEIVRSFSLEIIGNGSRDFVKVLSMTQDVSENLQGVGGIVLDSF